ncbi:unnamed protein product [Acanthoscelides obtectus]|nr:unnamed protein product [Acanthoscelides obtectus]CAK1651394.1 hypothetical protein AOBTE_LOCUS17245 [Acanthoscelides obtectus]
MENFDKNTPKKSGFKNIHTQCSLMCTKAVSTLPIDFHVSDYNNHDPEFSQASYSYEVPSPIMLKTDFTIYGKSVVTEDVDFSNQDVQYTIDPDDFLVVTIKDDETKKYTAKFEAKNNIQLSEEKVYTITATDTGEIPGPRSTSATIRLKPNKDQSLDMPSFELPQYSFLYKDESSGLDPSDVSQRTIKLKTTKQDIVQNNLRITGELKNYLSPQYDPVTSTVFLKLLLPIRTSSAFLISTLSVTTDSTATTSIIVHIQSNSKDAPRFTEVLFTGHYDPVEEEVDLDMPIEVSSEAAVKVTVLVGENSDYFSAEHEDGHFIIIVTKPLPPSILQEQKAILLKMEATSDNGVGYANLAISLPAPPKFDKSSYSIEYDAKQNKINMNGSISVASMDGNLSLTLKGDFKDYFKLEEDAADEYKINTTTTLPDKVLKEQRAILLEIVAEAASVETYATLVIKIEGVDGGSGDGSTDKAGKTPYVVAVCVMAGTLAAVIVGGVAFYCARMRKAINSATDLEDPVGNTDKVMFEKHNGIGATRPERKTSTLAGRRPTAHTFISPFEGVDDEEKAPGSTDVIRERKKSVIFDFNVEEMPVEKVDAASTDNSETGSRTDEEGHDKLSDKSDTESIQDADSNDRRDECKDEDTPQTKL